jgi:hypothetical protein
MPIADIKLPRLPANVPLVDANGAPTITFSLWWQEIASQIEASVNAVVDAQNAANAANAAAASANAAAVAANTAASNAQSTADSTARDQALVNSYIVPSSVVTSSPLTITITAHTRFYADGTSVAVSGGTVPTLGGAGQDDYVYYLDPSRAGGAVTYQVALTNPAQTGNTHVVGAVTVPAAGSSAGGSGPARPGQVLP